jgi:predicted nucleic acid-binding protein
VIVVDTSAWVELLRSTGSAVHGALRRLILSRADLAVTEVVVMELLAGARSTREERELRERLFAYRLLRLRGIDGYEHAAELYRACRSAGETLRTLTDCLVAVPAIEAGATLLHTDADFEILARHTPLRLEPIGTA